MDDIRIDEEELMEYIKRVGKKLEIIRNPNLIRFLRSRGIPAYGPLYKFFSRFLLISSIEIGGYDRRFQRYLQIDDFSFFSDLNKLIGVCLKRGDSQTRAIIESFLELNAIKSLRKLQGNVISRILMDDAVKALERKYGDRERLHINDIKKELEAKINQVEKKTGELLDYPDDFERIAMELLNEIKNNYETLKYLTGTILAFFDLLENDLEDVGEYFDPMKSAYKFYYPPRWRREQYCCIQDYLKKTDYAKEYGSINVLFEKWLLKTFDKLRHFEAHNQKDVKQDKLSEGIYKVKIRGGVTFDVEEYTREELERYYETSYELLLLSKHILARNFYGDDQKLFEYLSIPYDVFESEPSPFSITIRMGQSDDSSARQS